MDGLIPAMIAFPTVVFTILLGLVAIYWTTVIIAGLDVDILELDASVDANASEALTALGLRGVPLTVWLSFFVLIAWVALLLGSVFVGPLLQTVVGSLGSSIIIAAAGLSLSAVLTSFAVRPVRRSWWVRMSHSAISPTTQSNWPIRRLSTRLREPVSR